MQLERLEWDSKFFGFETGKLIYTSKLKEQIDIPNSYKLIYLYSDTFLTENELQKIISNRKVKFVDEKRSYQKPIEYFAKIDPEICLYTSDKIDAKLLDLTFQSGAFSRFKIDDNLSEDNFKKLYRLWIEHSLSDNQTEIIVCNINNELKGFVTLEIKQIAKIGLIAVSANNRSNKIGTRLINYLENRAFKTNLESLEVVTQGKNSGACRFYENYGFKLHNTSYVYHIWNQSLV